jgi:hypothetical protein
MRAEIVAHAGRAFPRPDERSQARAHDVELPQLAQPHAHALCCVLRYSVQRDRRHRRAVFVYTSQAVQRFSIHSRRARIDEAPHAVIARCSQEIEGAELIDLDARCGLARFPFRAGCDGRAVNYAVDAPPGERALDFARIANIHRDDVCQRAMLRQRRGDRRSQFSGVEQCHLSAAREQRLDDVHADIARGAGHQNLHRMEPLETTARNRRRIRESRRCPRASSGRRKAFA